MKRKLEQYAEWRNNFERQIVDFHTSVWEDDGKTEIVFYKDFKPFHKGRTELEEGETYVTIRCGLTGIYTCINHWMGGHWLDECADGSEIIAYRELKSYENLNFTPTVQDFFEYRILATKMNDQIEMILKHLVVIDKDAKYADKDNWEILEHQLPSSKPWPKEMYILGNNFYSVCVWGEGLMGPIKVEFPIAYLFMSEDRVKKDIEYTKNN